MTVGGIENINFWVSNFPEKSLFVLRNGTSHNHIYREKKIVLMTSWKRFYEWNLFNIKAKYVSVKNVWFICIFMPKHVGHVCHVLTTVYLHTFINKFFFLIFSSKNNVKRVCKWVLLDHRSGNETEARLPTLNSCVFSLCCTKTNIFSIDIYMLILCLKCLDFK